MKITVKTIKNNYNISEKSPIMGALKLLTKFFLVLIILYVFFLFFSFYITSIISLETEIKYFGNFKIGSENIELTKKLRKKFPDIKYSLSVIDDTYQQNAFAGLGGKIYLTTELMSEIETDNELLFLIGHEIGHVENRDVLKYIISETPIKFFLAIFGFSGGNGLYLFDSITFAYGKSIESKADLEGVDFVNNYNGHVGCVTDFFEKNNDNMSNILEIASEHPTTKNRIKNINSYISNSGYEIKECTTFSY